MNFSMQTVQRSLVGLSLAAVALASVGCTSTPSKWTVNDPAMVIYAGMDSDVDEARRNRDTIRAAGDIDVGGGGSGIDELIETGKNLFRDDKLTEAEKALARAQERRQELNGNLAKASAFKIDHQAIVSESVDLIAEELPTRIGRDDLVALVVDASNPNLSKIERRIIRDLRIAIGQHDVLSNSYDIVENLKKAEKEALGLVGVEPDLDDFSGEGEIAGWPLEDIYVLRVNVETTQQDGKKILAATTTVEVVFPKEQNRNIWGENFDTAYIFHPIRESYITDATEADLQRQYDLKNAMQNNGGVSES